MDEADETSGAVDALEGDWDDELIAGHEYDGIREYDNPVPDWLALLFWGTIVWSILYVVASLLGYVPTYEEAFRDNYSEVKKMRLEAEETAGEVDPEAIAGAVEKEERVEAGREVFSSKCVSCHGEHGGGQVGPNLTDDHWIHGGTLVEIYETVSGGVPDKGMAAWEGRLSREEIISTVAYIRSIRGTDPPEAKEPEGEKFVPEQ